MAFKASKKRAPRGVEPLGKGLPIVPSFALEVWYRQQVNPLIKAMIDDYRKELGADLTTDQAKAFFGLDASVSSLFTSTLKSLQQRWGSVFEGFASKFAPEFVDKVDAQSTSATLHSLSVAGLKAPTATYSAGVANTLQAAVTYNHTLITGIAEEVHEKVFSAVMLSLTSPNPEEQGMSGIQAALTKVGITEKKRVALISRDQTSKIYSAISDDRMEENGCEEFEWLHSSAGKVPRKTHVEKNGMIFKLKDAKLWEGPKADQGPPGWAINCRCRKVPVFR